MAELNPVHIAVSIAFMAALGLGLSALLAWANRKLWVFEDPRIDEIEEMLPRSNCGACGTAGCRPFAEALISGSTEPAKCTVNNRESTLEIAGYLGVEAGDVVKQVARLACAGGSHVARARARYAGLASCRAAAVVHGGHKSCTWGCLGLADCAMVCDQHAITMSAQGLPIVDPAKCTACGDCVDICPKQLFSLQPIDRRLWIACKNLLLGEAAEEECELACTGCGKCAADSPDGLITIRENLAVIDYEFNHLASPISTERCPTGAIVWLHNEVANKGSKAKKVLRSKPLAVKSH